MGKKSNKKKSSDTAAAADRNGDVVPQASGVIEPAAAAEEKNPFNNENRQPEEDVTECPGCKTGFGFFTKKHWCLNCFKIYCSSCASYSPSHHGDRVCVDCLAKEKEEARLAEEARIEQVRKDEERNLLLYKIQVEMDKCEGGELVLRQRVSDARDEQMPKIEAICKKRGKKILDKEEFEKKNALKEIDQEKKGQIIDKWGAVRGPRSGSLSLTVARAQRLVPPKLMLTTTAAVLVKGERVEFESDYIRSDVDPEWDFETYFAVEDDTEPIFFFVRDWTLPYAHQIASASLNLQDHFKNLVKTVTNEEVYIEKGHVILDCYKHDKLLPDTNLTVHWQFELREVNETKLCEDCGRIEKRCRCSEEDKKIRRDAAAKKAQERMQRELDEKEARHKEEHDRKEREREAREAKAKKIFDAGYADMEAARKKETRETEHEERRVWELVCKAHREGYHQARVAEDKRKTHDAQLKLCLGHQEQSEKLLFEARYQCWRHFVEESVETKRKKNEDKNASIERKERLAEDNAEDKAATKEENARQKTKREEQYQDESVAPPDTMVDDKTREAGRPRGEIHHNESDPAKEKKEEGGCCVMM